MNKINPAVLGKTSLCSSLTDDMVNKTREVLEKYKPYLTALPGTILVGMGASSGIPHSRPGILVSAKTEKDAKLLSNLLAKKIEGVPVKVVVNYACLKAQKAE